MKALVYFVILLGYLDFRATAAPINDSPIPWPSGTVLYHSTAATLTSISPKYFDQQTNENRITVKLNGAWQLNPGLRAVRVTPQAGIVIGADTSDRKQRLEELRSFCASHQGRKVDVYIYAGAVNKDEITYTWPELVKIVPTMSVRTK